MPLPYLISLCMFLIHTYICLIFFRWLSFVSNIKNIIYNNIKAVTKLATLLLVLFVVGKGKDSKTKYLVRNTWAACCTQTWYCRWHLIKVKIWGKSIFSVRPQCCLLCPVTTVVALSICRSAWLPENYSVCVPLHKMLFPTKIGEQRIMVNILKYWN